MFIEVTNTDNSAKCLVNVSLIKQVECMTNSYNSSHEHYCIIRFIDGRGCIQPVESYEQVYAKISKGESIK